LLFLSRNSRKSQQVAETTADIPSAPQEFLAARIGPLQVQGPFFGYFLLGLEKKVTRLPAGTGEVDVSGMP
jgi:hypothetical protein